MARNRIPIAAGGARRKSAAVNPPLSGKREEGPSAAWQVGRGAARSPIMAAWLSGDISRALEIAAAVPAGDPAYWPAQAILKGVAFDNGQCTLQDALATNELALKSPPNDPDLRAALLRNTAFFLIHVHRLLDARHLMREIESLQAAIHPRLRLVAVTTRWRLARAEDDYPTELAALAEGFTLVERDGAIPQERIGMARLMLHSQRLESALTNHDIRLAEKDVAAVRELEGHAIHAGWWGWEVHAASLFELKGQYQLGLTPLREMPPEVRTPGAKAADVIEAKLLIRLGNLAAADVIIDRLAEAARCAAGVSGDRANVAEVDVAALQGLRAMAAREIGQVWEAAETMMRAAQSDHPTWSGRANDLLAEAQLAVGQVKLARRLLESEDPDRAKPRYRMHWARLYWQEGDHPAAAECFIQVLRDVLPDYPGYVARQLQYALELSAYEAAQLWAMGIERLGAVSKPEAGAPLPVVGTLGRRGRILELFDERQRLTRGQIAAFLRCAPNTATRDLAALEAEGQIRRVTTSAHLRTSYFIRT